jgi:hypothetical protein
MVVTTWIGVAVAVWLTHEHGWSAVPSGLLVGGWGVWLFGRRLVGDDNDVLAEIPNAVAFARTLPRAFRSPRSAESEEDAAWALVDGLPNTYLRFRPSPVSLGQAWPVASEWEFTGNSDYGGATGHPDVEREFQEEVNTIQQRLEQAQSDEPAESPAGEPADGRFDTPISRSVARYLDMTDRWEFYHSCAFKVWSDIAVPYRRSGDCVVRITAPRMHHGSPLIRAWSVDEFLRDIAVYSATTQYRVWQLTIQRNVWVGLFILVLTIVGVLARR